MDQKCHGCVYILYCTVEIVSAGAMNEPEMPYLCVEADFAVFLSES